MFADPRRGMIPLASLLVAGTLGLGAGAVGLAPERLAAQEREILFNQVTVSGAEASLRLELTGDEEISVVFRDGRVLVDGSQVGSYSRGDDLDSAWRALLAQAIALENDALVRLLAEWSPPEGLDPDADRVARTIESRLTGNLVESAAREARTPMALPTGDDARALLDALVRDPTRLRELVAAVRNLRADDLRVHVGESVDVAADERVEGSLLMLDSDLRLDGTVDGDVALLGGRILLGDDARVGGDLRWAGAIVEGNRGAVRGRIRELDPVADRPETDLREEIRREVQAATAQAVRADRPGRQARVRGPGILRNMIGGIAGLIQTVVTFGILLGVGLAVLYFFPRNLEVVARTARNTPGRAAAVGIAGLVLAFPAWLLGLLVLVVSIVGIPVALLWLPAFPLAVVLAGGLGYLAVAHNLGRWASGRDIQGMENFDVSRPAVQIGLGLALLLGAFALAHVFQIGGPWFGFFKGLLTAAGVVLTMLATCVGLGAVLLSRGGRDTAFAGIAWDGGLEPDPSIHSDV